MTGARAVGLLCCLLGLSPAPLAFAAAAADFFTQGVAAFKRGNFTSALNAFRNALAAGLDTPTLHYNLGVSLYKLQRYAEAEEAFRACANDAAWAALAHYNIGLSAYQRGERARAAEHFSRAWRIADSEEVRSLALAMYERADPAAGRRVRGAFALNLGHNDNVTLTADGQTLETGGGSDSYAEISASATGFWSATSDGLRWDAALYSLNYAHLSENNITQLSLGTAKPAALGQWHTEVSGRWQYVLRDGDALQHVASLQLDGARVWPDIGTLRVGVSVSAIDALDPNFAYLTGTRQTLGVSLARAAGDGQIYGGVAFERNNRDDLAGAGEFFSYSPTRRGLWFQGSWPLSHRWRVEPGMRYYRGRYADAEQRVGGLSAVREDRENELTLRVWYRLNPDWHVMGEHAYRDTRSNFAEFSYTQRVSVIGFNRRL